MACVSKYRAKLLIAGKNEQMAETGLLRLTDKLKKDGAQLNPKEITTNQKVTPNWREWEGNHHRGSLLHTVKAPVLEKKKQNYNTALWWDTQADLYS